MDGFVGVDVTLFNADSMLFMPPEVYDVAHADGPRVYVGTATDVWLLGQVRCA